MYTYMCVCIYTYTLIPVCKYIYIQVYTYTHIHTCQYVTAIHVNMLLQHILICCCNTCQHVVATHVNMFLHHICHYSAAIRVDML